MAELRLTIEMVPIPLHYINLRTAMGESAWGKLSKSVRDGYTSCGICGVPRAQLRRLSCHEIWDYDDVLHVAHLKGFIALCDLCHSVKHIGLTSLRAHEGKLDFERVIAHFLQVNQCSREEYKQHCQEASERGKQRNPHEDWLVDLGDYAHLVPKDYIIEEVIIKGLAGWKKPFLHQYDEEELAAYRAEMGS